MYIIIRTHKRPKMLKRLLDSILIADKPDQLKKIIVIENGSHEGEDLVNSYLTQLPITYKYQVQGNKSLALNSVVKTLPEDALLLFFDDDIKIDKNVLSRFASISKQYKAGHFFGGGLRADYETTPTKAIKPYLPRSARDYDLAEGLDHKVLPGFYEFLGANWACYYKDLKEAGGFSPDFGPGAKSGARGQETDAQFRMAKNGVKAVAVGNAKVDHWVPNKFLTTEWVVERIFLSSIHLGKEKHTVIKSIGLLTKLIFSYLQYLAGYRSVGVKYRIAKAAGYFKGIAS